MTILPEFEELYKVLFLFRGKSGYRKVVESE